MEHALDCCKSRMCLGLLQGRQEHARGLLLGESRKPLGAVTNLKELGPVVQSNVSLTSSLRGQLFKCFMT